jgi:transitional endoplasmic reticulum ATPase
MKKDRERKERAEAAGEDVNLMDEDIDEDEVPSITV